MCVAGLPGLALDSRALDEGQALLRSAGPGRDRVSLDAIAGGDAPVTLAATKLYDNTGNPANTFYGAQGGAEAIDDLHLSSGGSLDTLVFEYYDPAVGGSLSATVRLYGNPGGLDLGSQPLAGPIVKSGLPRGRGIAAVPIPSGLGTLTDLWVGVQFTSASAGLIINSVPSVGSSHDLYLENGGFYWFGGDPQANFGLRIVGTPSAVSAGDGSEPLRVALAPAHPNPFRDEVTLRYAIGRQGLVRLDVCDVSGRRVRTLVEAVREPGRHVERWSGVDDRGRLVQAGVYFVRLESGSTVATRKIVFTPR